MALAWEYLRNVGINGAKPDIHLKRLMGSERMGVSRYTDASDDEVIREVKRLVNATGLTLFEIDYIIWCYCANGKGEVGTANPNCSRCIIREYCKRVLENIKLVGKNKTTIIKKIIKNGIVEGTNLIVTYDDDNGGLDASNIQQII